jgi:hypothetical protein
MLKNLHGAEPRNGHIDSRFGDPSWTSPLGGEKMAQWFLGDEETGPVVVCTDSPPGHGGGRFPVHAHTCDSIRFIVDGSFMIGRKNYTAGEIRVQEAGKFYGPEITRLSLTPRSESP